MSYEVSEGDRVVAGKLLARVKPKVVESFNFAQFFGKLDVDKMDSVNSYQTLGLTAACLSNNCNASLTISIATTEVTTTAEP